jgi:SAM-dependent methyltransferase
LVDIGKISSGLTLGADGIWYSSFETPVSYPLEGHQNCLQVEERSFWFVHRNRCITALLSRFPVPGDGPFLDLGGGNGFVSLALERAGIPVVLLEPGKTGAENAKRRGLTHVVCSGLEGARFLEASFSAVGLFDVIEHLPDESVLLRAVRSHLQPGGRLFVSVPAFPFLWSEEDEYAGHCRRYTLQGLQAMIEGVGLTPEFSTYIFRFLPIPILMFRTIPFRLKPLAGPRPPGDASRDHLSGHTLTGQFVDALLRRELRNLQSGRRMRFGGSILMVARS